MKTASTWQPQTPPSPIRVLGGEQTAPVGAVNRVRGLLCALTLVPLNLLAAIQLLPVYADLKGWLMVGLVSGMTGALIALIRSSRAFRPYLQVGLLLVAQFILGPIITLNGTTLIHVLPTSQTLADGFASTFGSFKALISIDPPLGWEAGGFMALWTLLLWTSFLAVFLEELHPLGQEVRSDGGIDPSPLLSILPILVTMGVSALLGTSHGWHPGPAGYCQWILVLLWASWRLGLLQPGRVIAKSLVLALTLAITLAGTLLVPQEG